MNKTPRFTNPDKNDFSLVLRKRINAYFKQNKKTKHGNYNMVLKTITMITLFFLPLIFLNMGIIEQGWLVFIIYLINGIGMAGIGMGVMHDAIHGSYSKNKTVNKILGYTLNLVGGNAAVWKIQHNVLHHTYTNVTEFDEDIHAPFFLRFSPHKKKLWIHKFQHIYAWFFYGLSNIAWITANDYLKLKRFYKMGIINSSEYKKQLVQISLWKILYFSYTLIIPLLTTSLSPWIIFAGFMCMHFVVGLAVSIVFQTAHVTPETDFPQQNTEGHIAQEWSIHQLATTCNFAPKSKILSWLIGGLNFQIEHHLFPNICHIHYKKISKIVQDTAKEYKVPYLSKKTFVSAIFSHYKMLKRLGTV